MVPFPLLVPRCANAKSHEGNAVDFARIYVNKIETLFPPTHIVTGMVRIRVIFTKGGSYYKAVAGVHIQ